MIQKNDLTQGKVGTVVLRFAFPFLLASLLQALYGAVDLFVVGQFSDSAAVAGVSIGSQIMQTITMLVMGLAMGGTVLIGHCFGEKNEKGTARAMGTLVVVLGFLGVVLTTMMLFIGDAFVAVMQTPAEAIRDTTEYVRICSAGILFIIGYNGVSSIFRGIGDSRTPLYFIALACAVNIAVDFALVGGMKLGAAGAAIATIFAQAVSFFSAIIYMIKKGFPFSFTRSDIRLDRESAKKILKVGFPIALQDVLVHLSFLIITAIINTMGLTASAAVGVVEKLITMEMLIPSAFAAATATVTAQNMGAKKPERAWKGLWYGIACSAVAGALFTVAAEVAPDMLNRIFSRDAAVIAAASQYLRSYVIDCILVAFVFCMNSYFSGCGHSMVAFVHSMIATFFVRIPMAYIVSGMEGATLFEVGWSAVMASAVSIVICAGYLCWLRKGTKAGAEER